MGRIVLGCRLVTSDLRRRPVQAVLLLMAIMAATTTATLAIALHGVTGHPYQRTRGLTAGPDGVAQFGGGPALARPGGPAPATAGAGQVRALLHAPGVTGHSGPYPIAGALLHVHGVSVQVEAQGRDRAPAALDQPLVTQGHWVSSGGVVIERTFALSLGVHPGETVTLNGRRFRVAGEAVSAAAPPFPNLCYINCDFVPPGGPGGARGAGPGLVWVTKADARALAAATDLPLTYVLNLKLADPAHAPAFASPASGKPGGAISLIPWQRIRTADALLVTDVQQVLATGSWLLGLLAVGSVAVLAGGRMAAQSQRAGLLKAVGAAPGLIAMVLLAENLIVALAAAAAGLAAGWLAAPLLTNPGAGLIGAAGPPSLTMSGAGLVTALAVAVGLVATLVPAVRAGRISTARALAEATRAPRRRAALIAISARLPVPLLLGLRLVARRPRRAALSAASIAVTVAGLVAMLAFHSTAAAWRSGSGGPGLANPVLVRDGQVLLVLTVVLIALAVLNTLVTTWATVLDARHASALARALGATPRQVSAALSAAQLVPALAGALAGIPAGLGLFKVTNGAGLLTVPPAWWLAAAAAGALLVTAALTAIPARAGARRPVAGILQAETART